MFSFAQNWFAPRANPIGIDFGSDCLRMAQVHFDGKEHRLIAAASADVPPHLRNNLAARMTFFVESVRDLLAQGKFQGRQVILGLPAASMFIQHLRVDKMDDEALKRALPWELQGKLPIDPSQALIRHLVAGEIYQDHELKNEVIVMAASRERITQLLSAVARARLDVIGMNIEPQALIDCFSRIYRRDADADTINCFVDIGCVATRATIARGQEILFARSIPVGGDHFNQAVAASMKIGLEDARLLRIKLCHLQPSLDEHREKQSLLPAQQTVEEAFPLLGAGLKAQQQSANAQGSDLGGGTAAATLATDRFSFKATESDIPSDVQAGDPSRQQQSEIVEQACRDPLNKVVEELNLCRRYYETTFPNNPVDQLIFVGGEARQRALCQQIARDLGLAAQVGDPLVRMGRISDIGMESGIDRRQPQPGWAIAIGLSMGPMAAAQPAVAGGK